VISGAANACEANDLIVITRQTDKCQTDREGTDGSERHRDHRRPGEPCGGGQLHRSKPEIVFRGAV
jgi:hypothetical protein